MAIIVFLTAYLVFVCYCHPDAVSFLLRQSKAKCQQLLQQLVSAVTSAAVAALGRRQEKQLEFRVHLIDCESATELNSPAEEEHCITPPWYQPSNKLEDVDREDAAAQTERTHQCYEDVVVVPEATMTTTTMTTPPTTPSPQGKRKLSILVSKLTPRSSSPRKFKLPYPSFPRVRVDARQE